MTTIINGSSPSITFSDGSAQTSATRPFQNRIINGAMVIDQRNAGASGTATGYTIDRWVFGATLSTKGTWQQNAGAITPPTGFKNYLGFTSNSAYTPLTGDVFSFYQVIEGFNSADLDWGTANAKTVTVSFWVRSSLTGTFGGALSNTTRSNPFSFTINAANTWEYKTVTVAGDTSGTWGSTNNAGIFLFMTFGAGSTYQGTAGTWATADYRTVTGAVNTVGTNGATFYITAVQLEVGSTATSFDYRSIGTELELCLRYFHFIGGDTAYQSVNTVVWYTANDAVGAFRHPVPMRTTPTISKSGDWAVLGGGGTVGQTLSADQNGPKTSQLGFGSGSGGTTGQASVLRVNNDSNFRLTFNAEL